MSGLSSSRTRFLRAQHPQSARGDRFAANLKSVVHTCRKQQRHVLNYLVDAVQAAFNHRAAPSLLARAP
jgi:hypothetical protein